MLPKLTVLGDIITEAAYFYIDFMLITQHPEVR